MSHDGELSRREFIEWAAMIAAASRLRPLSERVSALGARRPALRTASPIAFAAEPFDLHDVRLLPGPLLSLLETNKAYLMALDPDRLLHVFRVNAGIASTAKPYGGWEAPVNELRGHFVGHYLSACALMAAQTGDDAVKQRGILIVRGLAPCQAALGGGYLSAFPKEFFERLAERRRVWAPFYTYHKIMAGLLDTYTLSADAQALEMCEKMADWVIAYAAPIPDTQWHAILTTEYGGMNDVLRELALATGEAKYAMIASRFDQETFLAPLAVGRDELKGVHANTNVPKVLGAARWHEMTGDDRPRAMAEFFWEDVTERRAYATGGTSNGEEWQNEPGQLANALSGYTQETCVSYNMLKLTRHLFTWRPDVRYADYYERAYWNGIIPTMDPHSGEKIYYTPLADGYWKLFGTPEAGFWCCQGTGAENFSKLGDSIYFHDDTGVWVNLFVPSEVAWKGKGVRIRQETAFPSSDVTKLTVLADKPVKLALRVHVPYWTRGGSAKLDGKPIGAFAGPSSWLVVEREWRNGDALEVTLPMRLHAHPMPDDHRLQAVMYGPLVLVGLMGRTGLTEENIRAVPTPPREIPVYPDIPELRAAPIKAPSDDPASWLEPVPGEALEFRTVGQAAPMTFVPLAHVFGERYAAYFRIERA